MQQVLDRHWTGSSLDANADGFSRLCIGLMEQALASPAFDTKRFAKHFEDQLLSMWNQGREQEAIS